MMGKLSRVQTPEIISRPSGVVSDTPSLGHRQRAEKPVNPQFPGDCSKIVDAVPEAFKGVQLPGLRHEQQIDAYNQRQECPARKPHVAPVQGYKDGRRNHKVEVKAIRPVLIEVLIEA